MKVKDHIQELKGRFLKIAIPIAILFIFLFSISNRALNWILNYYNIQAYSLTPLESLTAQVTFAGIFTIMLIFPLITFQLYQFIKPIKAMPNIYRKIVFSEILAVIGFSIGILFFSKFMLTTLSTASAVPIMWGIKSTINIILGISFALAMILQFIIIIPILNNLGILNADTLKRFRFAMVIVLLLFTAIITPTGDMLTQVMLALPLWLSIEIGILLSDKKKYMEAIQ